MEAYETSVFPLDYPAIKMARILGAAPSATGFGDLYAQAGATRRNCK